ncbi:MAG: multicopper oxidase domain-containing protein [Aliidiomarina sp.]|uniref:multicopper oxidase domain-containing protein n=1 Tax=Aliidiomarina sp. TaxID=1872439 RepID=UPI0025BAF96B|nr:multicopper oxidase domain-containing protein [Aliidiomarina sp.]MCH8501165.1 multicopper oxidase domain-containing protein [Aliidiomarina sp.]
MSKKTFMQLSAFALALGLTACAQSPTLNSTLPMKDGEFSIDGMIFGLAEAEVFREQYDSAPVIGDTMSALPHLAPLEYTGNRVHEVRLDTFAQKVEVAPGVNFNAWTYGGSVPGPTLHVREGDRVVFTMKNRSDEPVVVTDPLRGGAPYFQQLAANPYQKHQPAVSPMPHSMDFHSGTVAADDKWRTIAPGETIRFEWVANYPGVYMYHCGTPSVLMHTAMGQYGAVVVSPKGGYPTDHLVDHEYVIVQSEFYLEKVGDEYIYDHQAAMNRNPSHVTFNGHVSALIDEPLRAKAGDRVRLYFLNAGPSDTSSFHVIGGIFDRVWYEGNVENEWRGMQTVLLGASNSAVMEFIVPESGVYKLVDHEFADAERGAAGALIATPKDSN